MDSYKEFTAKNLDEAIGEACTYFDTTRERLEIEIVQDAKSGIFGLVGARKAVIRAKRVQLRNAVDDILGRSKKAVAAKEPKDSKGAQKVNKTEKTEKTEIATQADAPQKEEVVLPESTQASSVENAVEASPEPVENTEKKPAHDKKPRKERSAKSSEDRQAQGEGSSQGRKSPKERSKPHAQSRGSQKSRPAPRHADAEGTDNFEDVAEVENVPRIPLEDLDQERLNAVTLEAVNKLTRLVVGDVPLTMNIQEGRVNVHLDCEENSGLLIGREGQTLSALQYLTSRIVSRAMGAAVRVQLDAGDYRTRQDEKLSDLALMLAEKVRQSGKPHSTRPLSSYHRRIIHVALQNETDLHTRSSGDGPLKRVIIQRKRG